MRLRVGSGELVVLMVLVSCQAGLWSMGLARLGWVGAGILHFGLVAVTWLAATRAGWPLVQLGAVLALAAGPFGVAMVALPALALRLTRPDPARLATWYGLLSGALHDEEPRRLAQDLRAGRVRDHPLPERDWGAIFDAGSRVEKQAALRWLVQQDLAGYRTELRRAMDDSDPAIRIEAAALFARLPGN